MDKIQPCRYCGGKALDVEFLTDGVVHIMCRKCYAAWAIIELKPCPVCGGNAVAKQLCGDGYVFVECSSCKNTVNGVEYADACRKWNRQ